MVSAAIANAQVVVDILNIIPPPSGVAALNMTVYLHIAQHRVVISIVHSCEPPINLT